MKCFVFVLAWFVMIFGINTTSDISKLLYVISNLRQFWNITSGIYAEYHVQIMLLSVYTTTCKRFVIFTCRYFKLSWNNTALSQSNCSNFSCSSVRRLICQFPNKLMNFFFVSHLLFFCVLLRWLLCFLRFTSLVSLTGSYTEDEPFSIYGNQKATLNCRP